MLKSKEIKKENARKLARLEAKCLGKHTTPIPIEFKTFIKPTGFLWKRTPLKAVYKCIECHQSHEVYFTAFTFWKRYSTLKVEPIVN